MNVKNFPVLAPQREIDRPLSYLEYYFASMGRSSKSLEDDCEVIIVIEGISSVTRAEWEAALEKVVEVHPACRLRLTGKRQFSRWRSDGIPMRVRYVENCQWEGRSHEGADFIHTVRFDLENGPTAELIITPGQNERVILRTHHAVMDGIGAIFCLQELFRALRGEPLLGTNAVFSDADLMQSVASSPPMKYQGKPASLTGGRDTVHGNVWRRLTFRNIQVDYLLGTLAVCARQFARRYSTLPVRILLPVNLRRHCAGLLAATNFVSLLIVEIDDNDSPENFRHKLRQLLNANIDAHFQSSARYFNWLPMSWVDWLGAKFARHASTKDTIALSNLGVIQPELFNCENFSTQTFFALPAFDGNPFVVTAKMGKTLEITLAMPKELASAGRFDAFVEFLNESLRAN